MKVPSPLLGYNTNVRHSGKLYHIQTEDSGVKHPHIITHLFADGGRIIATRKTSYGEHIGAPNMKVMLKKMMQEQHKLMFIALRDGEYDESDAAQAAASDPPPDANNAEKITGRVSNSVGTYQSTRPAQITGAILESSAPSIFGADLLSEKSLDEVILTYLAEDLSESEGP